MSVFFLVEVFFLVVVDFFVAGAVDFFLVVDAVSELLVLVVVIDSFLLAHDVIKPAAARTAMEQISDCFIGCGYRAAECPAARASASINWHVERGIIFGLDSSCPGARSPTEIGRSLRSGKLRSNESRFQR